MVPEESGCSGWNRISEQNPAFRHAHSPLRHAIVAPCQRKPLCMAKNRDREDHRPGWVDADLPERCPMLSSRRPRCRLGETPPAVFPRPGRRAPADALHDRPFWPARAAFADTRRPLFLRPPFVGPNASPTKSPAPTRRSKRGPRRRVRASRIPTDTCPPCIRRGSTSGCCRGRRIPPCEPRIRRRRARRPARCWAPCQGSQ